MSGTFASRQAAQEDDADIGRRLLRRCCAIPLDYQYRYNGNTTSSLKPKTVTPGVVRWRSCQQEGDRRVEITQRHIPDESGVNHKQARCIHGRI